MKQRITAKQITKCFWTVLVAAAFGLMLLNYAQNQFSIVDQAWFKNWQNDSERLVHGRIYDTEWFGFFHNAGLLGNCTSPLDDYAQNFVAYTAQMGVQGWFFSFLYRLTGSMEVNHWCSAALVVLSLFCLLWWLRKEFGVCSAVAVYVIAFMSKWLIVSARNLYWVPFTLLLPMVISLFFFYREEKDGRCRFKQLVVLEFFAIWLRAGCGYEFISVAMINVELPLFYYSIKNKWTLKKTSTRFLALAAAALAGFSAAVFCCLTQVYFYTGKDWGAALSSLFGRVEYRTGLAANAERFDIDVKQSLEAARYTVLQSYLCDGKPLIGDWHMCHLLPPIIIGLLLTLVSPLISGTIDKKRRQLYALDVMCLASVLGPLSWYILATPHASIHKHICYMLWSLPFLLLGGAVLSVCLHYILVDNFRLHPKCTCAVLGCVALCIAPLYVSYHTPQMKLIQKAQEGGISLYESENVSIYLYDDSLVYLISKKNDNSHPFFLRYITDDDEAELLVKNGVVNMDFRFNEVKEPVPFWSKVDIVQRTLPTEYCITDIITGQFDTQTRYWEAEVDIAQYEDDLTEITICDLSNDYWQNGFNYDSQIILVESDDRSVQHLAGHLLVFPDYTIIEVLDVMRIGNYYYIYVSELPQQEEVVSTLEVLR